MRKIIHIDMDAFYASIEQRDNPELKGKPVIVGGKPEDRSVVAACSYEARKFGIHSGMPTKIAYKLCPSAIFLYPRFDTYKHVSKLIRNIFFEYTNLVETVSLDEAYLDVSSNKKNAITIAKEIKNKILFRTSLTASAGVSFNKFLAKIASDYKKPDGLIVINKKNVNYILDNLPIKKFYGIGEKTEKIFLKMGVKTGKDLKRLSKFELIKIFGKTGIYYYNIARGIDFSPVIPFSEPKSLGREFTLDKDIININEIIKYLKDLSILVSQKLKEEYKKGKTITLKIKYYDFTLITRSKTISFYTDSKDIILKESINLLKKTLAGKKKIRLLGISVSNFENFRQLNLF